MLGFASGTQQSIMPDSYKAFWRHMHKKPADKLNAGNGIFFPSAFFTVVFYVVGDCIFIHADNAMVADGNPVSIFPKVVDNGLCTIKGFLAMRNPVLLEQRDGVNNAKE